MYFHHHFVRVPIPPAFVCYCYSDAGKPPQTQWLSIAIIYSHYYNLWVVSASHYSCVGLSLLHVPLIPTPYGDGRFMRKQGSSTHTFKASANITFANTSLAKAAHRLIKSQKWGNTFHLWWEILLGYMAKMWT